MIVIRNIFQLKFGKAKEVKNLLPEAIALNKKNGVKNVRALMDITGESYRMIFEAEHDNLAAFEQNIKTLMQAPEWIEFYGKFVPFVDSSYREILEVVG